jgi:hypothetical protein
VVAETEAFFPEVTTVIIITVNITAMLLSFAAHHNNVI